MADDTQTAATANEQTDETQDDEELPSSLNDAGKLALKKERDARKEAQRLAKQQADELAALKAEKAQSEAARQRAAEEEAARKGEFEKLANDRKAALDAATAEKQALAERIAAYEARDKARIETGAKDLPDDLKAFDPGDDAPLDQRLAWFEKAQKIAAERGDSRVVIPGPAPRPVGKLPKPEVKSLVHASSA
jgi:hypothetical protein